jgi:hypothetical protein
VATADGTSQSPAALSSTNTVRDEAKAGPRRILFSEPDLHDAFAAARQHPLRQRRALPQVSPQLLKPGRT